MALVQSSLSIFYPVSACFHSSTLILTLLSIDIMGTVTAPAPEVERANRQLEYIGLLPSMYGVGLWTSLPCPPELLADIILVNHMRATATDDSTPPPSTFSNVSRLFRWKTGQPALILIHSRKVLTRPLSNVRPSYSAGNELPTYTSLRLLCTVYPPSSTPSATLTTTKPLPTLTSHHYKHHAARLFYKTSETLLWIQKANSESISCGRP